MTNIIEFVVVNALLIIGIFASLSASRLADVGAFFPAKNALGIAACAIIAVVVILVMRKEGAKA